MVPARAGTKFIIDYLGERLSHARVGSLQLGMMMAMMMTGGGVTKKGDKEFLDGQTKTEEVRTDIWRNDARKSEI